jgi:hypothetical protein
MLNDPHAHSYAAHRPHHVAPPKPANTLGGHAVTARETILVQARPAVRAASHCLDCERRLLGADERPAFANAGGVARYLQRLYVVRPPIGIPRKAAGYV